MQNMKKMLGSVLGGLAILGLTWSMAEAKTVKVVLTAKEVKIPIDNKGTLYAAWTFNGSIPGPVVRVRQGDTVDFTLINPKTNQNSHAMDFHAAQVDVLKEFAPIKPGTSEHWKFVAKVPGVFMYHCGASPMIEHIARGMYGAIIVDPKGGFTRQYPKPDREYVLVQGQLFKNPDDYQGMLQQKGWINSLINGKVFHYDPVHDPNATQALVAKPGERVRIFFVNANTYGTVAFHPIAGIWDRVYVNGNPRNVLYGLQTYGVPAAMGDTFDIVSPRDRPTNNAIVDHNMPAALRGAITVLMNTPDADPSLGRGKNILLK
ncbi:multicopper oxidase domain-containing protein [Leptospirillum ferriphilum]|uniref:Copper-containing nitrite reductase n=1 Tax=Leptospirillum ferriphilum YSK TaxID=1441628 RepID=A0A059XU71_9BACT|nr:nitrite reductase [Leptospirillum ferriphilum YSK]